MTLSDFVLKDFSTLENRLNGQGWKLGDQSVGHFNKPVRDGWCLGPGW